MRIQLLIVLFIPIWLPAQPPIPTGQPIDFYLLLGQSNMAGRAAIEPTDSTTLLSVWLVNAQCNLEPARNPLNQYSTIRKENRSIQRLGPGYYFGQALSEQLQKPIALLVNARGGTPIEYFVKGGIFGYYEATLNRTLRAMAQNPELELKGILWQQGESNRNNPETYLPQLQRLIADLRRDLNQPNLPLFVGEMGRWNETYDQIREKVLAVPDSVPNAYLITSENLTNSDEHHFDAASQRQLGERYAKRCWQTIYSEDNQLLTRIDYIRSLIDKPSPNTTLVVAHRGDWRHAPENSLAAIENCIKLGVDIVEVDVAMTKDSVLVLLHDTKLDRTTTGSDSIHHYEYLELDTFRLKNGVGVASQHRIPTLEEALHQVKGRIWLDLDMKATVPFQLVYNLLMKTGTRDQVIVRSYRPYEEARAYYGAYLDSIYYFPNISKDVTQIAQYIEAFEATINPTVYVPKFKDELDPVLTYLATIQSNGDRIWVHTITADRSGGHHDDRAVDDPEGSYGWLLREGVSVFQTDRPQLLLNYLRSKNRHD